MLFPDEENLDVLVEMPVDGVFPREGILREWFLNLKPGDRVDWYNSAEDNWYDGVISASAPQPQDLVDEEPHQQIGRASCRERV